MNKKQKQQNQEAEKRNKYLEDKKIRMREVDELVDLIKEIF